MVDFRINWTLQIGAVTNRTYRFGVNAVRLETAPTGEQKCLFIFRIHHKQDFLPATQHWLPQTPNLVIDRWARSRGRIIGAADCSDPATPDDRDREVCPTISDPPLMR